MFSEDAHARNLQNISLRKIARSISLNDRLSTRAKVLGLVMVNEAVNGCVYASLSNLMRMCGFRSEATLYKARQELVLAGYVRTERRPGFPTKAHVLLSDGGAA